MNEGQITEAINQVIETKGINFLLGSITRHLRSEKKYWEIEGLSDEARDSLIKLLHQTNLDSERLMAS